MSITWVIFFSVRLSNDSAVDSNEFLCPTDLMALTTNVWLVPIIVNIALKWNYSHFHIGNPISGLHKGLFLYSQEHVQTLEFSGVFLLPSPQWTILLLLLCNPQSQGPASSDAANPQQRNKIPWWWATSNYITLLLMLSLWQIY